ncbi:unnamed protein product [Musa acuminata subsp. burmannicoides]
MPNTRIMIQQPFSRSYWSKLYMMTIEIMYYKNSVTRDFTRRELISIEMDVCSPNKTVEYGIIDGVMDRDSIIPLVPYSSIICWNPHLRASNQCG